MTAPEYKLNNSPSLHEVTRFAGNQLVAFRDELNRLLNNGIEQDLAIEQLKSQYHPKKSKQIDQLIPTLNQLAVGKESLYNLLEVVIRKDTTASKPSYYYELKLKDKSKEKPAQSKIVQPNQEVMYPFMTAAQRQDRQKQRQRDVLETIRAREERKRNAERERASIEAVMIDKELELGSRNIERGIVQIQLGEDGAHIWMQESFGLGENTDGTPKYTNVDRKTGRFTEELSGMSFQIPPDLMSYYNTSAENLERANRNEEPVEYKPPIYDPKLIIETYEKAMRLRIIQIVKTSEGFRFGFQDESCNLLLGVGKFTELRLIDLDKKIISLGVLPGLVRPLKPQFANYLKSKLEEINRVGRR